MPIGPITKNGKVVSADVLDPQNSIDNFLKAFAGGQGLREVEPMEMPGVKYGSKSEFNADQKAAEDRWVKQYGSLNNSNDGGKVGSVKPSTDGPGGGYTADYNPGDKGMSYRYSPTSGGSVMATSGGEIKGNPNSDKFRQTAIRNRMGRGKRARNPRRANG